MIESRYGDASWWPALKVASIFLVASALWIVGSDAVVAGLAPSQEVLETIQTYKGLAYTAVMSLLICFAVKYSFRREQRIRAALRESEERYRSFVATSAEGIWCYRMEPPMPIELPADEQIQWALDHGRVEECNDVYARLYGYSSAAEMVGLRFVDIVGPNEAIARDFLRAWLEGGYAFTGYEVTQLSRSGEEVWIHGSGVSVLEDGQVIRVWGTSIDITDRKRTELALEASEAKYRRLVESLDREYLIFSHGADGVFTYVSPSIESVLGYTQDEYARHYGDTFTDSPVNTAAVRHSEASIRGERQSPYEIEVRHKDGSTRQMHVIELPLLDEDGKVIAVEGISRDITEQKRAEEALRASEERYRSLFDAANDAVFVMEGNCFVACNSRTLEMFGCTEEQILHETPIRFSPPEQPDGCDSREPVLELIAEAQAGRPQFFEWQHCRYDGSPFDAEVSLNRFEVGGEFHLLAIVRDITERKRTTVLGDAVVDPFVGGTSQTEGGDQAGQRGRMGTIRGSSSRQGRASPGH
jgi:PAS domain S-box-containing protein